MHRIASDLLKTKQPERRERTIHPEVEIDPYTLPVICAETGTSRHISDTLMLLGSRLTWFTVTDCARPVCQHAEGGADRTKPIPIGESTLHSGFQVQDAANFPAGMVRSPLNAVLNYIMNRQIFQEPLCYFYNKFKGNALILPHQLKSV